MAKKPEYRQELTDPTGKLPPRDTDLEEVVLGACMLEKDAYMNVCDILVPDAFYDPINQKIFQAITSLGFNQRPIDMMTVNRTVASGRDFGRGRRRRAYHGAYGKSL